MYNAHFPTYIPEEESYTYDEPHFDFDPRVFMSHEELEEEARRRAEYDKETNDIRKEYEKLKESYAKAQDKIHALEKLVMLYKMCVAIGNSDTVSEDFLREHKDYLGLLIIYDKTVNGKRKRFFNEEFLKIIMRSLPDKAVIGYGANSIIGPIERKNGVFDEHELDHMIWLCHVHVNEKTGERRYETSSANYFKSHRYRYNAQEKMSNKWCTLNQSLSEFKKRLSLFTDSCYRDDLFKGFYGGCTSFVIGLYNAEKTVDWKNYYDILYSNEGTDRGYYDDILFERRK